MGGGYIECGTFLGEDKSGSAIEAVFEAIASTLPTDERGHWEREFVQALGTSPDGTGFSIESPLVRLLVAPLRKYYEYLGAKLGYPNPYEAPSLDAKSGLDSTEAKWGAGDGWRYYCAHDLLRACEVSLQTGEDIIVSFD